MKKLLFTAMALMIALTTSAQDLTVASFNIRLDTSKDRKQGDGWTQRCPQVCRIVLTRDFDIFGAQEVKHNQLVDMCEALPEYAYVGVGRDDGATKGEYSPVFYKKERFTLLDGGTFWLAETTDKPCKGWDARYPRICSWVRLKDKECKRTFWFFNLHMDHRGIVARRESSHLIIKKIKEIANPNEPVILTGDFNVDQTNEIYSIIAESGTLVDSYAVADRRFDVNGTFNNFNPQAWTNRRIDHIFISPSWKALMYDVLTDVYWTRVDGEAISSTNFPKEQKYQLYQTRMPSDHFPICVKLNYGAKGKEKRR
ncbi:MAG: endonuclease/exonuclease/phosphatase family protein [Alistipes sp.]|nr:endonuclease/exonuclease/phosphatase family protein [Alistipes sp.]MBQ7342222.1 endonuclease/exonuclease/phosphatase family protein [Alistipes sp.]